MILWSSWQCSPRYGRSQSLAGAACSQSVKISRVREREREIDRERDRETYFISGLTISGSILEAIKIKRRILLKLAGVCLVSGQPVARQDSVGPHQGPVWLGRIIIITPCQLSSHCPVITGITSFSRLPSLKFHLKMRSSVVWDRDSIIMKQIWVSCG